MAQNYADALAVGELQTLIQLFQSQDIHIINSQSFALQTAVTPTYTTSNTGGTIAKTTTVDIKVALRSGWNFYYGKSGVASAQVAATTGSATPSTHKITAYTTRVRVR